MPGEKDDLFKIQESKLVENLRDEGSREALIIAEQLEGVIGKARSLLASQVEKRNKENQAKCKECIRKLAYAGGNYKNGLLKRVKLTEGNLAEMKELGMGYSYSNDDLINRTAFGAISMGGNRVILEFPDGISGELYFRHSPEDGSLFYSIRKNCNRSEDEAA